MLGNNTITQQSNGNLKKLAETVKDFCGPATEKEALKGLKKRPGPDSRSVQEARAELEATIALEKSRLEKAERLYTQYSRDLQTTNALDQNAKSRELLSEALKRWKFQRKDAILMLTIALEKAKTEGVETHFFKIEVKKLTEKKGPLMSGFEHVMKAAVDTWSPQLGWF